MLQEYSDFDLGAEDSRQKDNRGRQGACNHRQRNFTDATLSIALLLNTFSDYHRVVD